MRIRLPHKNCEFAAVLEFAAFVEEDDAIHGVFERAILFEKWLRQPIELNLELHMIERPGKEIFFAVRSAVRSAACCRMLPFDLPHAAACCRMLLLLLLLLLLLRRHFRLTIRFMSAFFAHSKTQKLYNSKVKPNFDFDFQLF